MKCIISWRVFDEFVHDFSTVGFVPFALRVGPSAAQTTRISSIQKVFHNSRNRGPAGVRLHRQPHRFERRLVGAALSQRLVGAAQHERNVVFVFFYERRKNRSRGLNIAKFDTQCMDLRAKPRRSVNNQRLSSQQYSRKFPNRWPARVGDSHDFPESWASLEGWLVEPKQHGGWLSVVWTPSVAISGF